MTPDPVSSHRTTSPSMEGGNQRRRSNLHRPLDVARALELSRDFVAAFGGYSVEIPGAYLVVNEKVPVPRFNYVQDVVQAPGRVLAFIEKALEHYYQRALRPTIEVPRDVSQPALHRAIRAGGFTSRGASHDRRLLVWEGFPADSPTPPGASPPYQVLPVAEDDLESFVDLWTPRRYRDEILRYFDVVLTHPNPWERLVPYEIREEERILGLAVFYENRGVRGLPVVATVPDARSRGLATMLVSEILRREAREASYPVSLWLEGPRAPAPLVRLGFRERAVYEVYALPEERPLEADPKIRDLR